VFDVWDKFLCLICADIRATITGWKVALNMPLFNRRYKSLRSTIENRLDVVEHTMTPSDKIGLSENEK